MALLNSLFAGVSGLRNHQSMMDVIGNNISNVNTIGFKGSRVTFSDTFNQFVKSGTNPTSTSGGTNSFQIGLGMKINSIDRNWNQGTFERTGITTDLALQGQGLFILKSNGQQFYSRAGAFIFDADGKLVNPQNGAVVQGKIANGLGEIPAGTTLQDIVIDKNLRLPAVKTTKVSWGGNLQSSSTTIRTDIVELVGNLKKETPTSTQYFPGPADTDWSVSTIYNKDGKEYQLWNRYEQDTSGNWTYYYEIRDDAGNPLGTPITGNQALTFDALTGVCTNDQIIIQDATEKIDYKLNFSSLSNLIADSNVVTRIDKAEVPEPVLGAVTIFDSLGNPHTLSVKFEHVDNNRWSWSVSIPTTSGSLSPNAYGEIYFDPNGQIQSVWQAGSQVTSSPPIPKVTFTPASGAEAQIVDIDFGSGTAGVTQTNLTSQIAALSQNGSASAALSNLNIDQYGNIIGIFSNGNSRKLAQIMVATFKNLNALVSVGDNMYNVAANSGDPRIDTPGENSVTTIQSGALEQSNVDLSEEFTKMIISQRGFQANARVITTADNLLQEITNLIR
ncbi:Flagellar hook protein FlgE [Melioribacter roseus P3M-2]|uniref:Flagellar hook protein FlgE n=1 Tax=Melioribacter roseus (strain DSM 23840 / JCM 17771 / VKM B-2668 / P3M-2) TaxID=1191523 RepID=I7A2C9_MELRP|nr:flagellar hook protein FlgE [Melioribacter roseus]AFN75368.1 Flagellar hook protein FlgE [Melioribacter roseus P3M-2]